MGRRAADQAYLPVKDVSCIIYVMEALVEKRIAHLEQEVAELKRRVGMPAGSSDWMEQLIGSQKEEPEFDEVLRLGREVRQSDKSGPPS
jgi:hypothetical protein